MMDDKNKHTKHVVPPLWGGGGMGRGKSAFKKDGMFNEANPLMFELAKQLRKNMTHAELILWGYLKGNFEGLRFRRQHPIGIYIADFYCHKLKLVVEIDGSIHNEPDVKAQDIKRENDLKEWGYMVIRFTNERVKNELEKVLEEMKAIVSALVKDTHINNINKTKPV